MRRHFPPFCALLTRPLSTPSTHRDDHFLCEEPECADTFCAFATADELRRHHLERHSGESGSGPRVGWVGASIG